ncbi:MAG TPA: peroxiredoxin [Xanthobacteraceae bacterium]|nr:peroxiredoxin [Xanthobacteraceae bacterium]
MAETFHNPLVLPEGLPVPVDDGGARHLPGMTMPAVELQSTSGGTVNLAGLNGRTVVYIYPRTGVPGQALPDGWDAIPGARGCTPQTCSFRDHFNELKAAGAQHLFGLSVQTTAYQREVVERLHLPFAILSDANYRLTDALTLPSFETSGMRLLRRLTLVIDDGVIAHVFYPVFPPDKSAETTLAWLQENPA